jgi:hypothetical protein
MKAFLGQRATAVSPFHSNSPTRSLVIVCDDNYRRRESGGRKYNGENARRSSKGSSYSDKKRRRGRAAWLRSPDDTPLRDGNRDRLMGFLTERYVLQLVPLGIIELYLELSYFLLI